MVNERENEPAEVRDGRSKPGGGRLVHIDYVYEAFDGSGEMKWTTSGTLKEDYADGTTPLVVKYDPDGKLSCEDAGQFLARLAQSYLVSARGWRGVLERDPTTMPKPALERYRLSLLAVANAVPDDYRTRFNLKLSYVNIVLVALDAAAAQAKDDSEVAPATGDGDQQSVQALWPKLDARQRRQAVALMQSMVE